MIPSKCNRKTFIPHHTELYKRHNPIERYSGGLKHFRRFATRYDRQTVHFFDFIRLAAAMIWLR